MHQVVKAILEGLQNPNHANVSKSSKNILISKVSGVFSDICTFFRQVVSDTFTLEDGHFEMKLKT